MKSRSRKKPFLQNLTLEQRVLKHFSQAELAQIKSMNLTQMLPAPSKKMKEEQVLNSRIIQGDCRFVLSQIEEESVDLIFADPPFNLNKNYKGSEDNLDPLDYWLWTKDWLDLCIKVLKPGGSFFVYNIPQWAIPTADYLSEKLTYRHWIGIDLTLSMPIKNKLYPSHYSLLYFSKGVPNTFTPQRISLDTCKKCGKEQKDYGGYKGKIHEKGVSLKEIWTDITPVRHKKNKVRDANQLSLKLLDRIISMASKEGDLVLDPFAGSGTTSIVSEILGRKSIGIEMGPTGVIKKRLKNLEPERELLAKQKGNVNKIFTEADLKNRKAHGISNKGFKL